MPRRRGLDTPAAAAYLGLTVKTFNSYRWKDYSPTGWNRQPTFPPPAADGTWTETQLDTWNLARPGGGGPTGGPRPGATRTPKPCQWPDGCDARPVKRWRDEVTGRLLCKPHLVEADDARRALGDGEATG